MTVAKKTSRHDVGEGAERRRGEGSPASFARRGVGTGRPDSRKKPDGFGRVAGRGDVPGRSASARERPTVADDDLAAVYAAHFDFVWRSLRALGVAPGSVDDAAQDVFVVVHRRLGDYDGRGPIRGWLFGIARNVARRHRERARREAPLHVVPVGPALDDAMILREAAARVERFLDALDDDQRAVFVLAQLEGMTAPEIADALGINPNTAYSRLRAARVKFERTMARHAARERRCDGD